MHSFTEENYLKAIYKLSQERGEAGTSTNALAELLSTRAASVTDMLKKLSEKDLVHYAKYKGVSLSETGKQAALSVVRKHRLWEVFLHDKLDFGWDEVHEVAEQLEHIQSETLVNKLDEFLGFPSHDPHGDPIPDKYGKMARDPFVELSKVKAGTTCVLTGVLDHSTDFLRNLEKWGLVIGTRLTPGGYNAFDGTMEILTDKGETIYIGQNTAGHILVKLI